MTTKKPKPTKKDREWQKKIERNVKKEKIELDHPQGKERFELAALRSLTLKIKTDDKPKRTTDR